MKELIKNLYVGGDEDYQKVKDNTEFYIIRAAKEGPGGHRDTLGYSERAAPKDDNYLFVEKPRKLILNLVDSPNEAMVPSSIVDKAIEYAHKHLADNKKVLVCCNKAESRAPSLCLLILHRLGHLPARRAMNLFRKMYPNFAPSAGMKDFLRKRLNYV